jgi:hypothetical protein
MDYKPANTEPASQARVYERPCACDGSQSVHVYSGSAEFEDALSAISP